MIKDFIFLACFGLTCTFAYQAVEEERFLEQYLLSIFVVLQVNFIVVSFPFVPHVKFIPLFYSLSLFSPSFCSLAVPNLFASWCLVMPCRFVSWRNRVELCRVVPCRFVSCFVSVMTYRAELCRVVAAFNYLMRLAYSRRQQRASGPLSIRNNKKLHVVSCSPYCVVLVFQLILSIPLDIIYRCQVGFKFLLQRLVSKLNIFPYFFRLLPCLFLEERWVLWGDKGSERKSKQGRYNNIY